MADQLSVQPSQSVDDDYKILVLMKKVLIQIMTFTFLQPKIWGEIGLIKERNDSIKVNLSNKRFQVVSYKVSNLLSCPLVSASVPRRGRPVNLVIKMELNIY